MDLGQKRRGVDMGPSAIRCAGLSERLRKLGYEIDDYGNIEVQVQERLAQRGPNEVAEAIHLACQQAYDLGRKACEDRCFPLFLGGDHSVAIGTVGGVTHNEPAGLLWIDAHGDFNIPETSPNGNIHGMPVAVLVGLGLPTLVNVGRKGAKVKPDEIVLMGTRNLDFDEKTLLRNSGIHVYTMRDIDERGVGAVMREALDKHLGRTGRIHVSLDMDVLDPQEAPGVGSPDPGGMTYREAHLCMELLHDSGRVVSADIVEVNPILDRFNHTSEIAVDFATSLLGDRIL